MKTIWFFTILAALAALYYFNAFNLQQLAPLPAPSPQENSIAASFASSNSQNFLSFKDEEYGFKVKYPIGFYAEKDSLTGARVSFKSLLSEDLFEILRVDLFNRTLSKQDVDSLADEEKRQMVFVSRKSIQENGRAFELLEFQAKNPQANGSIFVYQGVFPKCSGKLDYSAIATASLTERLPQDKALALYFIYNFEC